MVTLQLVLLLLALVCFLLAALRIEAPRVNLLALGFVFWIGSVMIR
jgi:hypothetical protein